ncbi:hypothetical protein [Brachybacterium sp. SGAir0954]|uniref:hypothetical protein n=1 Tax=Brachybacterium sp. SGAir0954 TaxID=2571029 RepID=UPI0010F79C34|nr:hypothetical protein [Brachybacterium sp. SGAir0954]
MTVAVTSAQISAAESAVTSYRDMAVATGQYQLPAAFVDPESFAGTSSDGGDLEGALYVPAIRAKAAIASGTAPAPALRAVRGEFEKIVRGLVSDAGRKAATALNATRFTGGYTRMLNPPSCSRCAILAGRWFRWNDGFQRHPQCDCVHIPAKSQQWARDEGFVMDPYEYFNSLSEKDQGRLFGTGNAQAIRDGADIFQVQNARRGRASDGMTTTASTSRRRGIYRGSTARLTPDGIYERAGGNRDAALRLLEQHRYVLPGGQDPDGVIRGQREGYGQMGRGGKRVGARWSVEQARRTGVRHPMSRATMTAAERHRFDAGANWDAVREGRNPFGRGPLTDDIRRRVERDFEVVVLGFYGGRAR